MGSARWYTCGRPDEHRLVRVLVKVLPQDLELLADEVLVEGRRVLLWEICYAVHFSVARNFVRN